MFQTPKTASAAMQAFPDTTCKCYQLAHKFLEANATTSTMSINQIAAAKLKISQTRLHPIKIDIKLAGIFHNEWCTATPYSNNNNKRLPTAVQRNRLFNQLKQEVKQIDDQRANAALERKGNKQDVAFLQMSAIYLKQSLWITRDNYYSKWSNQNPLARSLQPGAKELHQLIFGSQWHTSDDEIQSPSIITPRRTIKEPDEVLDYVMTRFEVCALAKCGNRFMMQNTVDLQFETKIPESDRQVYMYELNHSRGAWEHSGKHTTHFLSNNQLPEYSTYSQYNLILQFGFQCHSLLQESSLSHFTPNLLFEVIFYASPIAGANSDRDKLGDMRRFSPDLFLPNFIQFQRYLQLRGAAPTIGLLSSAVRRQNVKRAFERINTSSHKFNNTREYNPAHWSRLWLLTAENTLSHRDLLRLHRIATLSHLKLEFEPMWMGRNYGIMYNDDVRFLLQNALKLWIFLTEVAPRYTEVQQAENGVWYIFPLSSSLNGKQDIVDMEERIDSFLEETDQWEFIENPREARAIEVMMEENNGMASDSEEPENEISKRVRSE